MSIADNLKQVLAELPQGVRLVAVSKFHPNEAIEEAYQAGQRIFGESKVQEMTAKYESLPKDIEWHFIGHLQTNKIKYMIPYVAMIHGIDSYKLLAEVNKQAVKAGRTVNCLLQIHVAQEETKFGFSPEECKEMLNAGEWKELTHVSICGLMGMASNTDCIEQINREFGLLNRLFNEIKTTWFIHSDTFCELSMETCANIGGSGTPDGVTVTVEITAGPGTVNGDSEKLCEPMTPAPSWGWTPMSVKLYGITADTRIVIRSTQQGQNGYFRWFLDDIKMTKIAAE